MTGDRASAAAQGSSGPLGAIAWDVVEAVAVRVAGSEPLAASYHSASLEPDLLELTATAERMVENETGLVSARGPARIQVVDRAGWIRANMASFQRLLGAVLDRFAAARKKPAAQPAKAARAVAGAEVGALLGWMSTRVLGQYDLLMPVGARPDPPALAAGPGAARAMAGDVVYYVAPNIIALEKLYALPPRQFRLWLALHELTHRAQFTGVPWMRPYFLSLVETTLADIDPDPRRLLAAARRAVGEVRTGSRPLDQGLVALFATPAQRLALNKVQGLMSVLEGHGDLVMGRAGSSHIPSAERFHQVLHQRRSSTGAVRLLQRLLGLEAKLRQYAEGERFLEAIESAGGPAMVDQLWKGPEWLPDGAEIGAPAQWLARVGVPALAAG
ncbi:MAG: zinc-dependent metalloprotease [Acidimicrobiales bacterium]